MKTIDVVVRGKAGLHARPASMLVRLTQKFEADIKIEKDGNIVNGKSIMGILQMAAVSGDKLIIHVDGIDESDAVKEILDFFNNVLDKE
ncbi:HPr family phosphocarrier protein [Geosporobacter ferrireducens]|uniref:Phosphocarrier protein HPr n=1 Tax=Geosporobacter ferrireducens TaxID=1424294 RepID=A0A1D8GCI4_9FIRM|nr:HPr family phosphocarrier protein [Geosporobacter ferrireducens]AOT68624.1 phosphocarrier protein HPr [Geosporobacter ferrireducens]MTI54096.1 HPr family phosphocarrier protein [Geosporobacter ferrireducens]